MVDVGKKNKNEEVEWAKVDTEVATTCKGCQGRSPSP